MKWKTEADVGSDSVTWKHHPVNIDSIHLQTCWCIWSFPDRLCKHSLFSGWFGSLRRVASLRLGINRAVNHCYCVEDAVGIHLSWGKRRSRERNAGLFKTYLRSFSLSQSVSSLRVWGPILGGILFLSTDVVCVSSLVTFSLQVSWVNHALAGQDM